MGGGANIALRAACLAILLAISILGGVAAGSAKGFASPGTGAYKASSPNLATPLQTSHGPIFIDGDSAFTPANGVTGGAGTQADPYRIEGWAIDAGGGTGLTVRNTTSYFMVRDVSVTSSVPGSEGIHLVAASHAVIERSNFTVKSIGIDLDYSANPEIRLNSVSGGSVGIRLNLSSAGNVTGNSVSGNQWGILLNEYDTANITGNQISGNTGYGIRFAFSLHVRTFHNNLANNGINAYSAPGIPYDNAWDDGYPSGGNYWSDYGGVDNCSGPAQNACPDPDGIGDTAYAISNAPNQDGYPLVAPYVPSRPKHSPILIQSNAEFTPANGVTRGTGTASDPYIIEGWDIDASSAFGIRVETTTAHFVIQNVSIHSGGFNWAGIYFNGVSNAVVRETNLTGNAGGLNLFSLDNVRVEDNRIVDNFGSGVFVNTPNVEVRRNEIERNTYGVQTSSAYNVTVEDNSFRANGYGIYAFNAWDVVARNNTFTENNIYGTELVASFDYLLEGNVYANNSLGLVLDGSQRIVIRGNAFIGDGVVLFGTAPEHFNSHTIASDNLVDGRPILYRANCTDEVVDGAPVGQVIFANCRRVTVANMTFSSDDLPIQIAFSQEVSASANAVSGNGYWGIHLFEVQNATLVSNVFVSNARAGISLERVRNATLSGNVFENDIGLFSSRSMNVSFTGNTLLSTAGAYFQGPYVIPGNPGQNTTDSLNGNLTISLNSFEGGYGGISIQDTRNVTVVANRVENVSGRAIVASRVNDLRVAGNLLNNTNLSGLFLADSINATITGNRIRNTSGVGIYVYRTTEAAVYGNQFEDNTIQALDDRGPENAWDAGYPTGGNIWSNYAGPDDCSGPNQDVCSGPDGIGDVPFIIDSDSQDRYPIVALPANTPPIADFSVSPEIGNATTAFHVDASASSDTEDPVGALEVRWDWEDDGTWDTSPSTAKTAEHTYATPGAKSIRLEVRDSGGRTATATAGVLVDFDPPVVTLSRAGTTGDNGWFRSPVDVTLSAVDDRSGVASISYRVDGGPWSPYAVAFRLADGRHPIEFFATDAAGNRAVAQSVTVSVDSVPPVVTITTSSALVTRSPVSVSWNGSDPLSGIARYEIQVDGGSFEPVGTGTTKELGLGDGDHVVRIRASDTAGNAAVAEYRFRVDTNVFSFTGPYGGIPTILLVVAAAVAGVLLFRKIRPRKPAKFEEPTSLEAETRERR